MDPLVLEGLRFGVAILAGGIVAVITSVLAFRYTRRLQLEDAERRDQALRRGLVAEIRENMQRLGGPDPESMPGVPTIRFAWDAARTLPLQADAFDAIARAYAAGEQVSRAVELVTVRAMTPAIVVDRAREQAAHDAAVRVLARDAGIAFGAFRDALKALGEPLMLIGAPLILHGPPEGGPPRRS